MSPHISKNQVQFSSIVSSKKNINIFLGEGERERERERDEGGREKHRKFTDGKILSYLLFTTDD